MAVLTFCLSVSIDVSRNQDPFMFDQVFIGFPLPSQLIENKCMLTEVFPAFKALITDAVKLNRIALVQNIAIPIQGD